MKNKLVMIGWDAATWDLLTPWVQAGELPNLARLMKLGSYGTLGSTPLPLSPAAWSTIVTGQNPGRHGVFDWFERKEGSYKVEYVHTGRIAAKTLWEYYSEGGKQIGVFNLPMVYPAARVQGFMVSGMAAPNVHAPNFAYPPDLITDLENHAGPFRLVEEEVYKYGREDAYLQAILDSIDIQWHAMRYLVERYPCDAYLLVFMQSDHIQHKFWRYLDPAFPGYNPAHDSRYRDAILQVYRALDRILGELFDFFGNTTTYILLSDHGAGPSHGIMFINRWLRSEGLLSLRRHPITWGKLFMAKSNLILRFYRLAAHLGLGSLAQLVSKPARNKVISSFLSLDDVDWQRTQAYSRGAFGQIFINLKGREPLGIVEPGEAYEQIVNEIVDKLLQLKHPESGEPLITAVHRREQVYSGPYLERAADVMFTIQDYLYQSSVKLGLESADILGKSEYEDSGTHRSEGILVMAGPGINCGGIIQKASVTDILPTVLALSNLPVPQNLDGQPLRNVFSQDLLKQLQYLDREEGEGACKQAPASSKEGTHGLASTADKVTAPDLADDELAQIEERLRNLGYLG